MRSDKPGQTQVYFATSVGPDLSKNDVTDIPIQGDGQWREYAVKLTGQKGYDGQLRSFRVDPVNGDQGVGAKVEIRWIRLMLQAP
jgi:hypothetical protein